MIKYRIDWQHFNSKQKYSSTIQEFNDKQHFQNFLNYYERNMKYKKIIGYERHYEETKEFSANDLQMAFSCGKKGEMSFEKFCEINFKKAL